MSDIIANALALRPLDIALEANEYIDENGEVMIYTPHELAVPESEMDEVLKDAEDDFVTVRSNIQALMGEGMDLFKFARDMAVNTQNPEHVQGAARMFSEALKANKELMNVHRDRFALKPPVAETNNAQNAKTINNIVFQGTQRELLQQLKQLQKDDSTT